MIQLTRAELAAMIDQTLLKPTVGMTDAGVWMDAATGQGFAAVCVSPFLVPLAVERFRGSATKVCSVAGFPLGYALPWSKAEEAAQLVDAGCDEVDMVMNVAQMLAGDYDYVFEDIAAVAEAVQETSGGSGILKVILETGYLDPADIGRACTIAVEAGAHFVKTSTGFGPRGASVEDVRLMRATVGPTIGVKAAGGIRTLEDALAMIEAGASRIGASAGADLLDALEARG